MHLGKSYFQKFIATIIIVIVPQIKTICQDNYEQLIKNGQILSYHIRMDEAEKSFMDAIKISPENPEGYFNIAQLYLWKFLGSKDRSEYESFMQWFDRTISKAEDRLDSSPADFYTAYLLGETYMFRAMAEITDHSYFSAYLAVKSAMRYYNNTLELNPQLYDAYRGIGEIHYFLDFIPGILKWAVGLTGLEANKAKGFSEIRTAYQKGSIDRIKSALSLSEVYSDYVAEYDSAETLLRELTDRFPENPMFNYHLAVVLLKNRNLSEAEKYLDAVLKSNHPKFKVLNDFTIFLKGDIFFKLNDFTNAIKFNKEFLSKTKEPDYTGIANYRLAVSYKILSDTAKMKKCLLNAMNGNQDIYDDSFANQRCEIFNRSGITPDEITMIKMKNNLDAGKYNEVYNLLIPAKDNFRDINIRAKALVFLSEAAFHLGKFGEASKYSKMSASINSGIENWIKPWSWYFISICSYKSGDLTTAKKYLDKATESDEYERNNIFYSLINNFKRILDK